MRAYVKMEWNGMHFIMNIIFGLFIPKWLAFFRVLFRSLRNAHRVLLEIAHEMATLGAAPCDVLNETNEKRNEKRIENGKS